MKMEKAEWEVVAEDNQPVGEGGYYFETTSRLRVYGGWLYRNQTTHGEIGDVGSARTSESMCFAPDARPVTHPPMPEMPKAK